MINTKDKEYITEHCKEQIKNKDKIRVKILAQLLTEHYALYEIIDYIKNDLKIAKNPNISISIFTKDWIEESLKADNCEELEEYLRLLLRCENDKKIMSLNELDEVS